MQCYFLQDGHIGAVEILTDVSERAAVEEAKARFDKRKGTFSSVEVWNATRFVYRHPLPPKYTPYYRQ